MIETIVAHRTLCAEPVDPDHDDGRPRMMPALGLTTVRTGRDQDAGAEFGEHSALQPFDRLNRAEERLSKGDLEGGMQDAADAVELVAHFLTEGARYIPSGHEAHTAVDAEVSQLWHLAGRLRKAAPGAQNASGK